MINPNQHHCHCNERRLVPRRLLVVLLVTVSAVVTQSFQTIGIAAAPRRTIIKTPDDSTPKAATWRTTSNKRSSTGLSYSSRTCPPPPQGLQEEVISKLVADTVYPQKRDFEKSISSLIQEVTTLQEFDDVIVNDMRHGDRLTVVRFHAPFCPACKAAEPSFHRMIYDHQKLLCVYEQQQRQQQGLLFRRVRRDVGLMNIHWVSVALTRENDDLRERLGLEVIPFGHIYHPSASSAAAASSAAVLPVEGLYLGRKYIADFDKILQTYVDQKCQIPEAAEPEVELEDPSVAFLNDGEL